MGGAVTPQRNGRLVISPRIRALSGALLLAALLLISNRALWAQSGGPVFALPGRLEDAPAPFAALLVDDDGGSTLLLAATAAIGEQLAALAAENTRVLVWGMGQSAKSDGVPIVRVSRVAKMAADRPATVRPAATPRATPVAAGTPAPTTYPTLVSLPAIGQTIADIAVYAAYVRAGPSDAAPPIATVRQGARCLVLGRAPSPGWYYLQCPGATGWVREGLYVVEGAVDALPALAPALSTPDPAATPLPPLWQITGYPNRGLAGDPSATFGADTVDFNWGLGAPADAMPMDDFSLRLQATLPFATGVYSVALTYDDGARLFVNDELVIEDWNEGAARTQSWVGPLAGDVPLRIEYFEAYSEAILKLEITPLQSQAAPPTPAPAGARLVTPPVGAGWLAAYYADPAPGRQPALLQLEALDAAYPLNREYSVESPAPGVVGVDNWSARWRGRFDFEAGDYRFVARGNEGVRLYIDGVRVIDAWPNQADEVSTIVRDVAAGVHEVIVEMYDAGGLAWVRAGWDLLPPAQ